MEAVLHPTEIVKNAQSLFLGEGESREVAERVMCGEVQSSSNEGLLSGLVEIQERRTLDLADGRFFCNPLPTWNFVVIIYLGGDKRREIEEVFDIGDLLRLIHGGYDVRVNVTDINGNWATGKTHIDSALETLKKGLMALLEIFKAVARIIAKVASMLLEVIKKIIIKSLRPVIEPIKKRIDKYIEGVAHALIKFRIEYIQNGEVTEESKQYLSEKILGKILSKVLFIINIITAVIKIIETFIEYLENVLDQIISTFLDLLIPSDNMFDLKSLSFNFNRNDLFSLKSYYAFLNLVGLPIYKSGSLSDENYCGECEEELGEGAKRDDADEDKLFFIDLFTTLISIFIPFVYLTERKPNIFLQALGSVTLFVILSFYVSTISKFTKLYAAIDPKNYTVHLEESIELLKIFAFVSFIANGVSLIFSYVFGNVGLVILNAFVLVGNGVAIYYIYEASKSKR